jgi:Tol biopolymer transport system component
MEPFIELYIADVSTGEVTTAFPSPTTNTDLSQPRWSPDAEWLAFSLRPVNGPANKMLWVSNLNGNRNIRITDDQSATFSSYKWDPWGHKLVYQRLSLGGSDMRSSLWVWDWQTRESIMILENALRPQWLP